MPEVSVRSRMEGVDHFLWEDHESLNMTQSDWARNVAGSQQDSRQGQWTEKHTSKCDVQPFAVALVEQHFMCVVDLKPLRLREYAIQCEHSNVCDRIASHSQPEEWLSHAIQDLSCRGIPSVVRYTLRVVPCLPVLVKLFGADARG